LHDAEEKALDHNESIKTEDLKEA